MECKNNIEIEENRGENVKDARENEIKPLKGFLNHPNVFS